MSKSVVAGTVVRPEFRPFESFKDAAAAVDRLIEIYERNTAFLRSAFLEALAGREQPGRTRACYPAVRLSVPSHHIRDSRLSYGHVAEPGRYQTTITRPRLF